MWTDDGQSTEAYHTISSPGVLYGVVPHMLSAKYQPNPPGGSGEEDF